MIRLVTFLGNPGTQYEMTRHNAGWMLADRLSELYVLNWQNKFKGLYAEHLLHGEKIVFLKPLTLMNRSGESVQACLQFFKINPESLLVVHDDIEMDFGLVGIKKGGGLAGHNGLRSIANILKRRDFYRFRIGVSRPDHGNVAAYVLSRFSKHEQVVLSDLINNAVSIFEKALTQDPDEAVKNYQKVRLY